MSELLVKLPAADLDGDLYMQDHRARRMRETTPPPVQRAATCRAMATRSPSCGSMPWNSICTGVSREQARSN